MATELVPLLVTAKELAAFNSTIGLKLSSALELGPHRFLTCEKYPSVENQQTDAYGIRDPSGHGRSVINQRRNEIDVFPIMNAGEDDILLGVTFEWTKTSAKFRYSNTQFIVYLAARPRVDEEPTRDADQLFRLEWQGPGDDGSFEASVAGHPHWQVDALPPTAAAPFSPLGVVTLDQLVTRDVRPSRTWLSRIHLASAANGWAKGEGWSGSEDDCLTHVSSPESIDELSAWTISAARYLNHQIFAAVI